MQHYPYLHLVSAALTAPGIWETTDPCFWASVFADTPCKKGATGRVSISNNAPATRIRRIVPFHRDHDYTEWLTILTYLVLKCQEGISRLQAASYKAVHSQEIPILPITAPQKEDVRKSTYHASWFLVHCANEVAPEAVSPHKYPASFNDTWTVPAMPCSRSFH